MRYSIWDKLSQVITPSGEVFTAEQWKERYPVANTELHVVCGSGVINGSYFGILEQMVEDCENMGCDFTGCKTAQAKLNKIEEFENSMPVIERPATPEERIAAALEAIELNSMTDVNLDDPDLD